MAHKDNIECLLSILSEGQNTVIPTDLQAWSDIVKEARYQKIQYMLYYMLKQKGLLEACPPLLVQELKNEFIEHGKRNSLLLMHSASIVNILQQAGVFVVVLKGPVLCETIYPNIALRFISDLDILIPIDNARLAAEVLCKNGIQVSLPTNIEDYAVGCHHHLLSVTGPQGLEIEIHLSIFPPRANDFIDMRAQMNELIERAEPFYLNKVKTHALSHKDMLLHLCIHAVAQHYCEGGLSQYMDIAWLLRLIGNNINWQEWIRDVEQKNSLRSVCLAILITKRLFGLRLPDTLLELLMPTAPQEAIINWAYMRAAGLEPTINPNMVKLIYIIKQLKGKNFKNYFRFLQMPLEATAATVGEKKQNNILASFKRNFEMLFKYISLAWSFVFLKDMQKTKIKHELAMRDWIFKH